MRKYYIKQNGYVVGVAQGKDKAIKMISDIAIMDGIKGTWELVNGETRFHYVHNGIEGHFTLKRTI